MCTISIPNMSFFVDADESDTIVAQSRSLIGNPKFQEMSVNIHDTYETYFVYKREDIDRIKTQIFPEKN